MNMRNSLVELLKLMVANHSLSEWEMGYILGVVDMATIAKQIKTEANDEHNHQGHGDAEGLQ